MFTKDKRPTHVSQVMAKLEELRLLFPREHTKKTAAKLRLGTLKKKKKGFSFLGYQAKKFPEKYIKFKF